MHPQLEAMCVPLNRATGRASRRTSTFAPAEVKTRGNARDTALAMYDSAAAAIAEVLCPDNPSLLTAEAARCHCRAPHPEVVGMVAKAVAELSLRAFANSDRDISYLMSGLLVDGLQFSMAQVSDLLRQAAVDLELDSTESKRAYGTGIDSVRAGLAHYRKYINGDEPEHAA